MTAQEERRGGEAVEAGRGAHAGRTSEGAACERPWTILEMFARKAELREVLAEALLLMEERDGVRQSAALALRDGALRVAASAGAPCALLRELEAALDVDAGGSGDALAQWYEPSGLVDLPCLGDGSGWEASGYWAEPILSTAGELLGQAVAFRAPGQPEAQPESLRIAARIAGTAMEHDHLMADLLYHARHDAVTLLPNQFLFEERLAEALAEAKRSGGGAALLYIDLDRFQTVNDLLGRPAGDLLLRQAARRMEAALGPRDTLARTAGDEFSAVLPGVPGMEDALRAAERLRKRLSSPIAVGDHLLTVTASIGCALFPGHADSAVALEQSAEAALYRAKQEGRNCVRGFLAGDASAVRQKARLESALSQALARYEFGLAYQPQVDLKSGALWGAEALLRWHHPEIGMVSPSAFIPIAEETGLILPIGRWVLREGCRQAAAWAGGMRGRVAINVSPAQFAQDDFVALVEGAIEESGVAPENVELELTETALAGGAGQVADKMRALKAMGLSFAVDDFGTGYSSLSHLQELPVDVIKIDISFVRQIAAAGDRSPVIETILTMAHALHKQLIAEGVENLIQQAYLAALGCDVAQGFLYGRPMAAEEFAEKWVG
ncbi:MAG TPA: bifunctional diguanylate cyclase/phosphodiesterase [Bryobacteraceae bacterium]|nr:bifunctional diguanylate cyclase/phosphodiesterase [Bryobacteraceae bacterium]